MNLVTADELRDQLNTEEAQKLNTVLKVLDEKLRDSVAIRVIEFDLGLDDTHIREAVTTKLRQAGFNARVKFRRTGFEPDQGSYYMIIKW